MSADKQPDFSDDRGNAYPFRQETHEIIGCAFEVLNGLGHGIHEKPYENALVVEFGQRGIPVEQQRQFPILYKGVNVGTFAPDMIAYGKIIVDAKVIDRITDHERGQVLNYLHISKLQLGLILNFKHRRLEWERVILSKNA
jgi:GxxExxY protein